MKPLLAALVALLLVVSPVAAETTGTITLDQASPSAGDSVTFTTTVTGTVRGSTYIWLYCVQPPDDATGVVVLNVRQPRSSSFLLDFVGQAKCHAQLVMEWTYGKGKVGRDYLATTAFQVAP